MIISGNKKWLLGSFLIFADNQFVARRARDILIEDQKPNERTGVLTLSTGEVAHWMNLDFACQSTPPIRSDRRDHECRGLQHKSGSDQFYKEPRMKPIAQLKNSREA
jgi:hypothetical protein